MVGMQQDHSRADIALEVQTPLPQHKSPVKPVVPMYGKTMTTEDITIRIAAVRVRLRLLFPVVRVVVEITLHAVDSFGFDRSFSSL